MLQKDEILQFIDTDKASEKKKFARVGQRYYEGNHDIKDYELYYYNADGELVKDKTRSNIKISHPFFTEIVDQSTQYMLSGKDGFVKSDLPERTLTHTSTRMKTSWLNCMKSLLVPSPKDLNICMRT